MFNSTLNNLNNITLCFTNDFIEVFILKKISKIVKHFSNQLCPV